MVKEKGLNEERLNIISITGVIFGILGILLVVIGGEFLLLILAIFGLVFSGYAHNKKKTKITFTGIILNIILVTLGIFLIIMSILIFSGPDYHLENIEGEEEQIKGGIRKLLAEDESRKIVVYPSTREIKIRQGESNLGFGFAIRNLENKTREFRYKVIAQDVICGMNKSEADNLISQGKEGNMRIPAESIMDNPVFVKFDIQDNVPPCDIRYETKIEYQNETTYASRNVDLKVEDNSIF